jgi:hypothetical protein
VQRGQRHENKDGSANIRAKRAGATAWRLGIAAISLAALALPAFIFAGGVLSFYDATGGVRFTIMVFVLFLASLAGAIHTWRTAPRIVVHEDYIELGKRLFRAHGIEMDRRKEVRYAHERLPATDVLSIHAIDEDGTHRTTKLSSREWPDIGAVESAVREFIKRAVVRGYR